MPASFNATVPRYEPIAQDLLLIHSKIGCAMGDKAVRFLKCPFVQQEVDALTRGELALLVLPLAALRSTTCVGGGIATLQLLQPLFEIHGD